MRGNSLIQMMSGRYYQGCGAIAQLAGEAALLGSHARIISDRRAWEKFGDRISAVLNQGHITYETYVFSGLCSAQHYDAACRVDRPVQMVIGVGGGRAMDAAKIAADKLGVRVITIPTSASTCAATAWLSVHYENDGPMIGNYWSKYSPFATIVELDFVALDCPARYNAAGILDAMAKYPEILYNIRHLSLWEKNIYSHTAGQIAKESFFFLLEHGAQALRKCAQGIVDQEVEDVICAAISVTGLTSVLACGGKQAAVSHSLYAYFCGAYPELSERFIHGELVSASMPYQMAIAGIDETVIRDYVAFAREFGAPVSLRDLGIEIDKSVLDTLFEDLERRMPVENKEELVRMRSMQDLLVDGSAYRMSI